jgi:hypothetical protein
MVITKEYVVLPAYFLQNDYEVLLVPAGPYTPNHPSSRLQVLFHTFKQKQKASNPTRWVV